MNHTYAMILAGGSGTRFWPLSRRALPKQLLPLVTERSMVRETVERLFPMFAADRIFVVTGADHAPKIREELPILPVENIIDEPVGRDTAAAIALFATFIEWRDPQAVFVVLPADHYLQPIDAFQSSLTLGAGLAATRHSFVTFGIQPRTPSTAYGYIQRGEPVSQGVYTVRKFHEKPDAETARRFLATGGFYWNSGMFVWKAEDFLEAVRAHLPAHAKAMAEIRKALGTSQVPAVLSREYSALPRISVDYGIMEKVSNVLVSEARYAWSDVGSWSALQTVRRADPEGNIVDAQWSGVDTSNSIVIGPEGKLIATLGVRDLVIVQTEDATLVCHRDRADELKKLIDRLQKDGKERYL